MFLAHLSLEHQPIGILSGEFLVVLDQEHVGAEGIVVLLQIGVEGEEDLVLICECSFFKSLELEKKG